MPLTNTTTGLAGEHLTAAVILELGYQVAMAQQDKIDLLAFLDGEFFRVQVKSARIYQQTGHSRGYQFQLGSGSKSKRRPDPLDYDILATCAVDQRRVHFEACCAVKQTTQRRSPAFFERHELEADSWSKAVEIVRETRL